MKDEPIIGSITPDDIKKNEALKKELEEFRIIDKLTEEKEKEKAGSSTEKTTVRSILDHLPWVKVEKSKDEDTLVDIHVNNPMKKIIELLEDIKKQKAFSFTFKGSLGIMGVALVLSVFGLFGGNQVLCEKGVQSRAGILKVLQLTEEATDPNIPWSKAWLQKMFFLESTTIRHRAVLLANEEPPIHLSTLLIHKLNALNGQQVVVTGKYNSCSSTIVVPDELSIEAL